MKKNLGNIHSLETFATVDGPGIRFVVFMQGCPMRCLYCHNPDTWNINKNKLFSAEEIIEKYNGVREFCKGGITLSGGEPLLQIDFAIELFSLCKKHNINTALDTSGICFNPNNTSKIDELIKYTDLVMLDIKHIDNEEHKKLTTHSNSNILAFARYLDRKNVSMWIRHVVVPNITFKEEYLERLGEFISTLRNAKAIDILPYHDMAKEKYEKLNIVYPLENISPITKQEALEAKKIILNAINKSHKDSKTLVKEI